MVLTRVTQPNTRNEDGQDLCEWHSAQSDFCCSPGRTGTRDNNDAIMRSEERKSNNERQLKKRKKKIQPAERHVAKQSNAKGKRVDLLHRLHFGLELLSF